MNKKTAIVAAIVAMGFGGSLSGQSMLSTQYPGGLPQSTSTGPSAALGGAGTGVQNDYFGFADNPGNLGAATRLVFSGLLSYNTTYFTDGSQSDHLSTFAPRLFSFEFPLAAIGTFGFSFDQRSAQNFGLDGIISSKNDSIHQSMVGGLKCWQVGWGHSIGTLASVGVGYERIYFSSRLTDLYPLTNSTIANGAYSDSAVFSSASNGIRAGILIPVQKLTFGVSGEYVFKGTGKKIRNSSNNIIPLLDSANQSDTIPPDTTDFTLSLPPSISVGVSYVPSQNWLIAGSMTSTFWSRYSSSMPIGVDAVQETHNTLSFSLGAQYIPAPNMLLPHYWQIMQYRGGLRYSQLPDGHSSETVFDAGIGLPLLKGNGLVDITASYGRRNDSRFAGYGENFLQFSLGINGGRPWSQNTGVRY